MLELRQSTAVTVKIGPFVDSTDGNTDETGLTLSQADIRLSKNGGDMAQKNESSAATHDELGYYDCALNTTDTNTLGVLELIVHKSGALTVRHEYMVVSQQYWDSKYSTDRLQVDVVEISGDSTAADNLETATDGGSYNIGGGGVVAASVTGAVGSVTGNVGGNVVGSVASVTAGVTLANDAITAAKYDETTAFPLASADAGATAVARTGADADTLETLSDQLDATAVEANVQGHAADALTAYDPPTNAEMEARTLVAASYFDPAADVVAHVTLVDTTTTNTDMVAAAPTAAAVADAVWNETLADHLGAGSTGNALNAAGSAGDPWSTAIPGAYGAGTAGKIVGDNLNATVSSRSSHSAADVWAVGTRTLSSFGTLVADIWAALTSGLSTVGSVGKLIVDYLNASVSSRAASSTALSNATWTDARAGYLDSLNGHVAQTGDSYARLGAPAGASVSADIAALNDPTAAAIADAVWDEATSGHATSGTTGKALTDAQAAGDPWSTALPGSYGAGTAGYIIGTLIASASNIASTVWTYITRTLTQSATSVSAAVSGSSITDYRGVYWNITIPNLTDFTGYTKVMFTVKSNQNDGDSASLVQLRVTSPADATNDGLLYINGAAATHANGSITVNSSTSITVVVEASETAKLTPAKALKYDVKAWNASGKPTLVGSGTFVIDADITRAT